VPDLLVAERAAPRRHARGLADGGAAALDDAEQVLVGERVHDGAVVMARGRRRERGGGGAVAGAARAVAARAVGRVQARAGVAIGRAARGDRRLALLGRRAAGEGEREGGGGEDEEAAHGAPMPSPRAGGEIGRASCRGRGGGSGGGGQANR